MPFEMKEQPKEKNCVYCGHPMRYEDHGESGYIWRCTHCRYKETLAPLLVDLNSLQNLMNRR